VGKLQQAAEIARPRKHEAAEIKKKMERLRVEAIDLYELVQDGRRNVDEAIAALDGMQELARREADERAERERLKVSELGQGEPGNRMKIAVPRS
jgi:hypothetical protein